MVIFGVALLAFCMLLGVYFGDLLGIVMGVDANIGGVGISMVFLVLIVDYLKRNKKITKRSEDGMAFWGAMYIPIVIAMSAQQNVAGAISGGPMAITAGVFAVAASFALVPVITKIGRQKDEEYVSKKLFK